MRFNEVVCNSTLPMHIRLQNNNILQRSSSDLVINEKVDSLTQSQEFHIGQDTSTYSSFAVTRSSKTNEHNINNNLDNTYQSSSTESLADYEGYYEDPAQDLSDSDWSEYSEDGNLPAGCRGIVNPNYPGFQHLGPSLLSDTDDTEDEREPEEEYLHEDVYNNNSNIGDEAVNRLDSQRDEQKQLFYEKPKFNIQSVSSLIECMNYVKSVQDSSTTSEIFDTDVEIVQLTTSVKESLQFPEIEEIPDSSKSSEAEELEETTVEDPIDLIREANAPKSSEVRQPSYIVHPISCQDNDNENNGNNNKIPVENEAKTPTNTLTSNGKLEEIDLLASINRRGETRCREHQQQSSVPDVVAMELDVLDQRRGDANIIIDVEDGARNVSADAKKKEKMLRNHARRRQQNLNNQRSRQENKRKTDLEGGSFDVYNIETAMPKIDIDAIERHMKAAREEARRRLNDREEIRRRLAMGPDADDIRSERGKKPSLQSRLQSGMNLQICFMNETSSDSESAHGQENNDIVSSPILPDSPTSTSSSSSSSSSMVTSPSKKLQPQNLSRPQVLSLPPLRLETTFPDAPLDEADFFARQARLQTEARMALAQAKEMAHMQMEVERQKLKQNPITEMVRASLQKIGVTLGEDRRRLTRALLTELNIAQLQVLANDLHARIATLNEALVEGLLRRDDLHMEQDSMLVDVEDLTRYLGAKQESFKKRQQAAAAAAAASQYRAKQQTSRSRTLALLGMASSTRLAAGRQLVVNLVRK